MTGREFEWQLSAADLGAVRQWLTEHGDVEGFKIEARPTQSIDDTYLDTEDWHVHRAGFALRVRDLPGEAEATLKDLTPAHNGFKARREFNQRLGSADELSLGQGDGPVSTRVQAVAGACPLRPLFRVRTQRQRFAVLREDREAGEIALDETTVASLDGRSKASLRRVEVEALSDPPQALTGLVDRLRMECALQPAVESKYDAGLKSSGLVSPGTASPGSAGVAPTLRIREVARANLLRQISNWLGSEPGARLGEDPERLHDMRVAGRRLEAMIRLFDAYLPRSWNRLRPRLKALMGVLGAVRDLDVQLIELDEYSQSLEPAHRTGLQPLRDRIEQERRRAREQMLRVLDQPSTQRLMQQFRAELSKPTRTIANTDNPLAAVVAPSLIRRRYRKVRREASHLGDKSAPEDYHRVRRRVKRLRYALDAFEGFYGKPADDLLRALMRVQNSLGAVHDAQVAARRIQVMAGGGDPVLPAETTFLMGAFFEQRRAAAERVRRQFPKAYRKMRGRRWKRMRRTIEDLALAYAPLPSG